jgi:HEPN domain-containing protein
MFDINKQYSYWAKGAESDLETAGILINGKKYVEGLFFCHLTIEKYLKALIIKNAKELAPKSHNLAYLSELAKISVTDEQVSFMAVLMKYQLEGRYPEYYPNVPSIEKVKEYFHETKALLECLKTK